MKNNVMLCAWLGWIFIGCGENAVDTGSQNDTADSADTQTDSETASDDGTVEGLCENAVMPFHYCDGANLVQFTGQMTQTADACIFASEEVVCAYEEGCTENADTDDVCWHPCNDVTCDAPPADECADEFNLNSYDPDLPLTGGTCTVITSGDGESTTECFYVSVQIPCANGCVTAEDGPDYCTQ